MRSGIILAAVLTATTATVIAASAARADDWCGYATKDNAVIECGYTSAQDCANAVGKDGMCFVDPDTAQNETRGATPVLAVKRSAGRG